MWNDLTSIIVPALAAVWAITIVALIIHGRRDAVRYFTARSTWIAFGKGTLGLIAVFGGLFLAALVLGITPWLTVGSFLVALLTIIPMPFQAVWNWFTDRSLGEQLLIVAVVMTWVIVATIRRATDRIITAISNAGSR
jgi:hypothetical protein